MKIIVTGKTGVGKTSVLKNLKFKNTLFADEFVKENLYADGHQAFDKIIKLFGIEVISGFKIDIEKLRMIVLQDLSKLEQLSRMVIPFIRDHIQNLEGDWLIEMAGYINYQEEFAGVFDKIVLVERNPILVENKFWNKNGEPIQTIKDIPINADFLLINDGAIEEASDKLHNFLLSIGFKCI